MWDSPQKNQGKANFTEAAAAVRKPPIASSYEVYEGGQSPPPAKYLNKQNNANNYGNQQLREIDSNTQ